MEKTNVISEMKHYIECPYCKKTKNQVDHLFNDGSKDVSFGVWYCDECGCAYKGIVVGNDVFIEKVKNRLDKSVVFLRKGNVLLCVKGMIFDGEIDTNQEKYHYMEHTCPTNYLKDVEMVIDLNDFDTDPHGIFEYLFTIPYIDLDKENVDDLVNLINNSIKEGVN